MVENEKNYFKSFEKFKKRFSKKAEEYANDKGKAEKLIKKAIDKANRKKGPLEEVWDKMQLLFSIVGDYVSGKYKEIPFGSIILIIISIIYFVSPIDAIPDFIVGLGLIDDATILGFVIAQINSDLEKYKKWKENNEGT